MSLLYYSPEEREREREREREENKLLYHLSII